MPRGPMPYSLRVVTSSSSPTRGSSSRPFPHMDVEAARDSFTEPRHNATDGKVCRSSVQSSRWANATMIPSGPRTYVMRQMSSYCPMPPTRA